MHHTKQGIKIMDNKLHISDGELFLFIICMWLFPVLAVIIAIIAFFTITFKDKED